MHFCAIHFDKMRLPTLPFQLPTVKTYTGTAEMMESELDFIRATVLSRSMEDCILYSDMPIGEMADNPEFRKKWMAGMAMMLKKGLRLKIIHDVYRPFPEMMLGLEGNIPMYMTGQIEPYYLPAAQGRVFSHLLKVSGALGKDVNVILTDRQEPGISNYSLRLYDKELVTFSLEADKLAGIKSHILTVKGNRKSVFPLDLVVTDDGIAKWLRERVIPRNRANADAVLKTLGLSAGNVKGIIDRSLGLSLNDSYWVVPLGFEGTFKEYNLYENRCSSVLSLVAYTGVGQRRAG